MSKRSIRKNRHRPIDAAPRKTWRPHTAAEMREKLEKQLEKLRLADPSTEAES